MVIPLGPAQFLREQGFTRNGRNFHREKNELIQSVYFQTFRGGAFSFTVNLTVILLFFNEICRGEPFPKNPCSLNCSRLASKQVSYEGEYGPNVWWNISSGDKASALG